jgi:hypothetical protein
LGSQSSKLVGPVLLVFAGLCYWPGSQIEKRTAQSKGGSMSALGA